ncbi:MAG: neutral zinc metallopeptidase [Thermoproteota archaeon]|jgi:predicted metalloprotease|nr:neutral zinc metallopeptidase [Thermoproteota archaeon]
MRWRNPRRSGNIEDRRGMRVPMKAVGGGIGGLVLLIITLLMSGGDPGTIFNDNPNTGVNTPGSSYYDGTTPISEEERQLADFVSIVLADTEDTWNEIFAAENLVYREPTLVLFSGAVESACGFAQSAVGPFYCPLDEKVYIDLSFYKDLRDSFGAPGDFAQAYVIAHEIGHHVQNQIGIMEQVQAAQQQVSSQADVNRLSVMLELQADCLSGVWAYNADRSRDILEQGDIEEGLNAASSIGDDRLQMQFQGQVTPDSFTHGSSVQRVSWFERGLESGDINSCNSFEGMNP